MAVLLHIEDVITGNTFGERLRNARLLSGLSAQEVADRIGVKYPTYMSYENKNNQPRQETLVNISVVLRVSIDQLLGRSYTQYGQLARGKVISLPTTGKIDITPILQAIKTAIRSGRAVYYDTVYDKTIELENDDEILNYISNIEEDITWDIMDLEKKEKEDKALWGDKYPEYKKQLALTRQKRKNEEALKAIEEQYSAKQPPHKDKE